MEFLTALRETPPDSSNSKSLATHSPVCNLPCAFSRPLNLVPSRTVSWAIGHGNIVAPSSGLTTYTAPLDVLRLEVSVQLGKSSPIAPSAPSSRTDLSRPIVTNESNSESGSIAHSAGLVWHRTSAPQHRDSSQRIQSGRHAHSCCSLPRCEDTGTGKERV